jgi:hypothetical protein
MARDNSPSAASGPAKAIPAFDELRCIPLHPTQDGGMSKAQSALRHHLHQIAQAELVVQVPAHAQMITSRSKCGPRNNSSMLFSLLTVGPQLSKGYCNRWGRAICTRADSRPCLTCCMLQDLDGMFYRFRGGRICRRAATMLLFPAIRMINVPTPDSPSLVSIVWRNEGRRKSLGESWRRRLTVPSERMPYCANRNSPRCFVHRGEDSFSDFLWYGCLFLIIFA